MWMRKRLAVAALALAVALCGVGNAGDVLGGELRSSCEALLCLSTGARPGECSPSLGVYYAIHGATPVDTMALRMAFLMLCPTGGSIGGGSGSDGEAVVSGVQVMSDAEKEQLVTIIVRGESGVNVRHDPPAYQDSDGDYYQPNYYTVSDTADGTAYRNHPNIVDVPDHRGLYINDQKAVQQDGKVYLQDSSGGLVEYRMNGYGQYVPAGSGGGGWGRNQW